MVARLGNTDQAKTMFTEETYKEHLIGVKRLRQIGWTGIVTEKLVETCGIHNAKKQDYKFAKVILKCLGKYCNLD